MGKRRLVLLFILVVSLAACGRGDTAAPTVLAPTRVASVLTTAPEAATAEATGEVTAEGTASADAAGEAEAAGAGDAEAGRVVFNTAKPVGGASWMCSQCHPVTAQPDRIIGPTLWNIAEYGAERVEGQTAEEYVRTSILHPNDFIAPGNPPFPESLMPQDYEQHLTNEELEHLVAYLFSLK